MAEEVTICGMGVQSQAVFGSRNIRKTMEPLNDQIVNKK